MRVIIVVTGVKNKGKMVRPLQGAAAVYADRNICLVVPVQNNTTRLLVLPCFVQKSVFYGKKLLITLSRIYEVMVL